MSAQGRLRDAAGEPVPAGDAVCEGLRVGFTITKRVGHATERNRIRRRLRDAVARAADDLPRAAADIVLIARRPALHAPFETLVADLRRSVDAVVKPGGGKRSGSGPSPHGRGRGGQTLPSQDLPSGKDLPSSKAGSSKPASGKEAASGRTAAPVHHQATTPAQHEAQSAPRACGDAFSPSPPSNTRDGSLDG